MSALISIVLLGSLLLLALSSINLVESLVEFFGDAETYIYLFSSIIFVVVVGFPFVLFAYLDWSRKRVLAEEIEKDARLKDALAKSMNTH